MNPHDHYITWASGRARITTARRCRVGLALLNLAAFAVVCALVFWIFAETDCNAARTPACSAVQEHIDTLGALRALGEYDALIHNSAIRVPLSTIVEP